MAQASSLYVYDNVLQVLSAGEAVAFPKIGAQENMVISPDGTTVTFKKAGNHAVLVALAVKALVGANNKYHHRVGFELNGALLDQSVFATEVVNDSAVDDERRAQLVNKVIHYFNEGDTLRVLYLSGGMLDPDFDFGLNTVCASLKCAEQ
ncbi:hypothetical protein IC619_000435 [Hazenella sp. IB182353]|uniref:hypothetical protein n=1 Tax=Polycladospora coralii TaxID=2771432 RepID=UPI00174634C2|nr:hypothetical protein [Polycladospora coralii]MBS7528958.1 hypothetical protein [Polycladospora coralii]